MPIEKLLALSTAHMPCESPEFPPMATVMEFEEGYVLFACEANTENSPTWLKDIMTYAVDEGCTLVMFDRDVEESPLFPTYGW